MDSCQSRGKSRSKSRGKLNASVKEKDSLAQVWHKRLGHISEAGLQVLEKQGLFDKKSLGRHTTQRVIDYVHSNLWGPSQVESLGGKRYFLSIVDDYSRRLWVYLLRFKHEAFEKFKEWKQLVENQTGRTVKKLQGLFDKKSLGKLDFFENCVLGKSHQVSVGVGRHTTQRVIDYVHSNLWGPSQVESLGGKRYFLSIVDDYSRRLWVYLLWFKHEAFEKFKEWKQLVENQTGRTVKKLRTDNGFEFCNREFKQLCIESGIARNLTVAEKPQQNGLAERMNRTLIDKDSGAGADKSIEELQVEVELQRLNNHTLEEDQTNNEDQTDQDDSDDEDAGDQEIDQPPDLTDYQLVRDREPRIRTKPLRFRDESNMAAYAFAAVEEEDTYEPLTYQEAVACEDSSKWKAAIKEEMNSLRKNKTWELVDHQAGQKLPPGYEQGNKVCLLKKSLYGLKQSPRQWYRRFDEYMLSNGFKHSSYDIYVYYRSYAPGEYIYLLLYVDDMLIACKSKAEIGSTKSLLKREFDMKDLGEQRRFLVWRSLEIRVILKYLRGTANVGLIYRTNRGNHKDVTGFVDSEYAKDPDKGRSITGYAFLVHGCVVSWKAMLQHVMALSTTEAEYMALTEAVKEAIWLRGLLEELGVELNRVTVNCDNQGAIHLSRNHVFLERTKHINVCYHFIREVLEAKKVEVLKVNTEHNAVDALTKVVPGHKLQHCLELLSVGTG
nr:retrotransposon protein, putative, Ty1-copia subclass [Tanacetum cinerariifolium]